jgi:hypothetical protein
MDAFWAWLGQTIVTFGVTILGFIAVRSTGIGEKLLDHHWTKQLAELKHSQDQKIEALKADLANLQDRGKRANEREFEALSAIWEAFVDAFLKTNEAVMSLISHPDLPRLTPEELTSFLQSTDFSPQQRAQVEQSVDKNKAFGDIVQLRQIHASRSSIFTVHLLLRTKGIFVAREIIDEFKACLEMLSAAQAERYVQFHHRGTLDGSKGHALIQGGEKKFDELQSVVRKVLRND